LAVKFPNVIRALFVEQGTKSEQKIDGAPFRPDSIARAFSRGGEKSRAEGSRRLSL
jgi:hypothetical protein